MKILQVFDFFSPYGGGVASVTKQMSKGLADLGHEVTIYTTDYNSEQEYIDSLRNVNVKQFKSHFRWGGMLFAPSAFGYCRKHIKDFDVIHLQSYTSFLAMPVTLYAAKHGIPFILDAHGNLPRGSKFGKKWLFQKLYGSRILKKASRFIAETDLGKEEYQDLGISGEKVEIIPPGFDMSEMDDLPEEGLFREKIASGNKKLVVYLGRIHEIKGIDFLIESFAELTKKRDDVILVVAGKDDGHEASLKELAANLGIAGKVVFAGFISQEEKKSLLVDSSVFVQPSRYEQGIAWTTLEAILTGSPIIVTNGTGAGEDISKMDAGYLLDFGDKEQMCKVIEKVLDDPSESLEKSLKGKDYILNNLTLEQKTKDFVQLYNQIIEAADTRN